NWVDIRAGLPDIPGWAVTNDPLYPEIIYFGNEFGVYISLDDGENWSIFNEGLGDGVFAIDLKISMADRKLKMATHGNGAFERDLEIITGTESAHSSKPEYLKLTNHPNPFSRETNIGFHLDERCQVTLSIFDISGKLVDELVNNTLDQGEYQFTWNPSLCHQGLKNGTYLCRLIAGKNMKTIKLQKQIR
nr:T9SS type A sorting domain-containing protein [Bacteroidota bacterium]